MILRRLGSGATTVDGELTHVASAAGAPWSYQNAANRRFVSALCLPTRPDSDTRGLVNTRLERLPAIRSFNLSYR
jgi:hypothetical protein